MDVCVFSTSGIQFPYSRNPSTIGSSSRTRKTPFELCVELLSSWALSRCRRQRRRHRHAFALHNRNSEFDLLFNFVGVPLLALPLLPPLPPPPPLSPSLTHHNCHNHKKNIYTRKCQARIVQICFLIWFFFDIKHTHDTHTHMHNKQMKTTKSGLILFSFSFFVLANWIVFCLLFLFF